MKVSDEIRDWCDRNDENGCGGFVTEYSFEELCDLADRIDAELVELPNDADGVPIHIDDTVWNIWGGGEAMTVKSITLHPCGVAGIGFYVLGSDTNINPTDLTHTRTDSWERIADELDKMVDAADSADDRCERIADLANRIRKLSEKED